MKHNHFPKDRGVFPVSIEDRLTERTGVIGREFARRAKLAGLPAPEHTPYENLGNPDLPVYRKKREIQSVIRDHQISMVEGPTGSGKSTQIAQYALEMGYSKVVYLEPRVLLADNLSDQIIRELDAQLGGDAGEDLVGVRHSARSTGHGKKIEIMTPATFMRVMPELEEYEDESVLIVGDEIHEKDFESELAVAASVFAIEDNPKWRLLLASATLDSDTIHKAYTDINKRQIPLIRVEGRPHELERIEESDLTAVEALTKYIGSHKKAMLFTAGKQEISNYIKEVHDKKIPKLRVTPLHAKLSRSDVRRATHAQLADDEKQLIVSTSAGQSGITVPGLTLVVSDGMTRRPHLDRDGTPSLVTSYCAEDELTQQAGRAGRDIGGGVAILTKPFDSSLDYSSPGERDRHAPAQIYHTNISRNVLLATATGHDFYELNKRLIHKVDQLRILEAYDVLHRLGAIDENNQITKLGKKMNRFPLRPELSRPLVEAMDRGADRETLYNLIAIVSAVEAGGLPYFERGISENWRQDIREETRDDYVAQLDMFYATRQFFHGTYVDEGMLESRNYDIKNTYRAHRTFDKICRELKIEGFDPTYTPPNEAAVSELHDYLLSGLFDYVHRREDSDNSSHESEYVSVLSGEDAVRRKLSKRGTYKGSDPLVFGMPRGFEKKRKGEVEIHYVIENVAPVAVSSLTRYVKNLANRRQRQPRVVGGRLVRESDIEFGSVHLGTEPSTARAVQTPDTRRQIREAAYKKPTQALHELITIKKELERLVRLTPKDEVDRYFPDGIMTDQWLNNRIDDAITDGVDSVIAMDNNLRSMISQNEMSLSRWVTPDMIEDLLVRSPEVISLSNGETYSVYYSHGKPIVNRFNLRDADLLPDDKWFLPDGREILINHRLGGSDTKRYSAGEVKKYARSLD